MVYDVNNRRSFENVEKWLDEITEHANDQVTIMLIGNKIDLVDKLIFDDSGDKWSFKRVRLWLIKRVCFLENVQRRQGRE